MLTLAAYFCSLVEYSLEEGVFLTPALEV